MRLKAMVISVSHETSKKDGRIFHTLSLLDRDAGEHRLKNTVDFQVSVADHEKYPDLDALVDQTVEFSVVDIREFGGRTRLSGHILSIPSTSLKK